MATPLPPPKVRVRMYCHGFGDCFLLTFDNAGKPFRILIDCGMLTGNSDTLKTAIKDIRDNELKGQPLDVVVLTHEHKDHISGFNLKENGRLIWDSIRVNQVWQAWTENPDHALASELKARQAAKKKALNNALTLYMDKISSKDHVNMMMNQYRGLAYLAAEKRYANVLQQLNEFNQVDDGNTKTEEEQLFKKKKPSRRTIKNAMDYFADREASDTSVVKYFKPGDLISSSDTGLTGVRFFVLGPPEDYNKLKVMDDPTHQEMYLDSQSGVSDNFFLALLESDLAGGTQVSPFSDKYLFTEEDAFHEKNRKNLDHVFWRYYDPREKYRMIDIDWLHNTGLLALHLDSYTNNTSLVLAIEFESADKGKNKVLLFPGDAQIGNWLTWTEKEKDTMMPKLRWDGIPGLAGTVTAEDLLNRTVFYKVGHHASHNATARKHGLEMMKSDELVAMIPVDQEVAENQGKRGWAMPAKDLYRRLIEKTKGRIVRADKGLIIHSAPEDIPLGAQLSQEQKMEFQNKITKSAKTIVTDNGQRRPLYYEYKLY